MRIKDDVVIVSAARTPIGRFLRSLSPLSATDLGGVAIRAAVERAGIPPEAIAEVIMGQVVQAGTGMAPARNAALKAGLPSSVGAVTLNKVCGSGLKAVMTAASYILAGEGTIYVAGGMESMSQGPYLLPGARTGYRMGNREVVDATVHDGLWSAWENVHMGMAAEWIAEHYGVSREAQDVFAFESHVRALQAIQEGRFDEEIVPVAVPQRKGEPLTVTRDECPRPNTSLAKLAALSPAFKDGGSVTAGNAPPLSDGAAALVVMHGNRARELGIRPMARILGYAQAAVEPIALFTAPIYAIRRLWQDLGWGPEDADLYEINEAFAAQMVADMRELGLDQRRVNVNGGAIALGHPIGASGARILVTLLHALKQRGLRRGIAALCLGEGEAVALAVEMVD
ncbi:MAG: acetyl-CoA C-acetyltransferase [Chloroflexi bacterium]|nr:acetyl-CoA C-acetyltransferase [Chloroflexota bacterium]